jgi:Tol biopolymer transport system component
VQLVRVSISDGSVKVLKPLGWRLYRVGSHVRVSPDGRYIAYSARAVNPSKAAAAPTDPKDQHIYILASDGSSETEIVKTSGINRNPVWTPDGKHILFTSDRSGKIDLWSVPVENGRSTGAESLVSADLGNIQVVGMVAGSYYYTSAQQGEYVRIAEFAQNSGGHVTESFIGIRPTWSPDGKSVAFKRHHPGSADAYDLVVRSLESGEERTYPTSIGTTGPGAPVWFHDGKSIMTGFGEAIYRVDEKTAEFKQVLPARGLPPVISPDDKTLYQVRRAPDGKTPDRILSIDLTTGEERPIFVAPGPSALSIALSPDGRTLALGWLDTMAGDSKLHIARVSVNGSDFREVYTVEHLFGGQPVWSKDGGSILFRQEQPGGADHWGVMRVPATGGAASLVFEAAMLGFDLSPDGSRIAYGTRESLDQLWALDNVLSVLK